MSMSQHDFKTKGGLLEMSELRVRKLSMPNERSDWDKAVQNSDQDSPFLLTSWLERSAAIIKCKAEYWIADYQGQWITGVCVVSHSRLGRKRALIPMRTPYFSLWVADHCFADNDAEMSNEVLSAAVFQLLAQVVEEYDNARLLLDPSLNDRTCPAKSGWTINAGKTYLIDLSAESIVDRAVRKHVRKCDRAGYTVTFDWELETFWEHYADTATRQGFSTGLSQTAFCELAGGMFDEGLAWMATALSSSGEWAASRIQLVNPDKTRMFDWLAASDEKHLSDGINSWLMMQIMDKARGDGFRYWDLCGADYPSVARFKKSFGGDLIEYLDIQAPKSITNRVMDLGASVVQKLRKAGRG